MMFFVNQRLIDCAVEKSACKIGLDAGVKRMFMVIKPRAQLL